MALEFLSSDFSAGKGQDLRGDRDGVENGSLPRLFFAIDNGLVDEVRRAMTLPLSQACADEALGCAIDRSEPAICALLAPLASESGLKIALGRACRGIARLHDNNPDDTKIPDSLRCFDIIFCNASTATIADVLWIAASLPQTELLLRMLECVTPEQAGYEMSARALRSATQIENVPAIEALIAWSPANASELDIFLLAIRNALPQAFALLLPFCPEGDAAEAALRHCAAFDRAEMALSILHSKSISVAKARRCVKSATNSPATVKAIAGFFSAQAEQRALAAATKASTIPHRRRQGL